MAFQSTALKSPGRLWLLALCLLLSACASQPSAEQTEDQTIRVLCPSGAPALASLGLYEAGAQMDYVSGQDNLVAELSKTGSDYDIIIAPINLGVKAFEENETWYLEDVLTWGNLYIVGEQDWDSEGASFDAFGQNAVPGLVFNDLYKDVLAEIQWLPSVAEASESFLLEQSAAALLAEPQATVTLQKAASQGRAVSFVADLQQEWQDKYHTEKKGYPQAALFVKDPDDEMVRLAIAQMITFSLSDQMDKEIVIDEIGAEKLGVPSAAMAMETWDSQNIDIETASQVSSDIETFLNLFDITVPENIFAGNPS